MKTNENYALLETVAAVTEAFTADPLYRSLMDVVTQKTGCHEIWQKIINFAKDMEDFYSGQWECDEGEVDYIITVTELTQLWVTMCANRESLEVKFSEVETIHSCCKAGDCLYPARGLSPQRKPVTTITVPASLYTDLVRDARCLSDIKAVLSEEL